MFHRTFFCIATISLSLCLGLGSAVAAPSASSAPAETSLRAEPVGRLLVFSIPATTWESLDLTVMPHLSRLLAKSSVASLSVRGARRHPSLGDSYVSISAGTRAVAAKDSGHCFAPTSRYGPTSAADAYVRRSGIGPPDATESIVCVESAAVRRANDALLFDAKPGLLADTLNGADIDTAVIGNSDSQRINRPSHRSEALERNVSNALTNVDGVVQAGSVGTELFTADASMPFGIATDIDGYLYAFRKVWNDRRVVVAVEASDLVRLDAFSSGMSASALDKMRELVFRRTDALLGRLLKHVDTSADAVLVVSPVGPHGRAQLTPFAIFRDHQTPHYLESGFTRRAGVVAIVDVGPTILDIMGVAQPDDMEGRPAIESGVRPSLGDALTSMQKDNNMAVFRDKMIAPVTTVFVVAQICLVLLAAFFFATRSSRGRRWVEVLACALLLFLPTTFLSRFLPFEDWGPPKYWLFVSFVPLVVSLVATRLMRGRSTALIIALLSLCVALLVADVLSGARLQYNTVFGYSATIAGRFAGLGNLAYSQLAAASVLLGALVAFQVGQRYSKRLAMAAVIVGLTFVVIVDGAPMWGSDVGGVLSMAPAFTVTVCVLCGWRVRIRTALVGLLLSSGLIALFAAIDVSRPSTERSHLGRLVGTAQERGWHGVSTILERKLDQNLDVLFSSIWTLMLPSMLLGIAWLIYRAPGRLAGIYERVPAMRAGLAGLLVLGVLGFGLNDSGIAIPGVMLGIMTPVLVLILAGIESESEAIAVTQ